MPAKFLILLLVFFIYPSFEVMGQKLLVLERAGTVKNFKYKVGDDIVVESSHGNQVFSGPLTEIKDNSVVIKYYNEVSIHEIAGVYRQRTILRIFSGASISSGIFYFSLDGVNRIINNDSPVIPESTIIASGILIGSGFLMKTFVKRKFDLKKNWRLKILNFDSPVD
jgi:hypothetical protein